MRDPPPGNSTFAQLRDGSELWTQSCGKKGSVSSSSAIWRQGTQQSPLSSASWDLPAAAAALHLLRPQLHQMPCRCSGRRHQLRHRVRGLGESAWKHGPGSCTHVKGNRGVNLRRCCHSRGWRRGSRRPAWLEAMDKEGSNSSSARAPLEGRSQQDGRAPEGKQSPPAPTRPLCQPQAAAGCCM